jgi:hypothetical protein|tara:strand:- start:2388 stop:2615 length:228 start_codon:yes stop_codon:yes gene_type:complete
MNKKIFTAQLGSGNTIKVFDAVTGQLYRIISTGGNVISSPIVVDHTVTVTVLEGGVNVMKIFSLPNGGLKSVTSI